MDNSLVDSDWSLAMTNSDSGQLPYHQWLTGGDQRSFTAGSPTVALGSSSCAPVMARAMPLTTSGDKAKCVVSGFLRVDSWQE